MGVSKDLSPAQADAMRRLEAATDRVVELARRMQLLISGLESRASDLESARDTTVTTLRDFETRIATLENP